MQSLFFASDVKNVSEERSTKMHIPCAVMKKIKIWHIKHVVLFLPKYSERPIVLKVKGQVGIALTKLP